MSVPIRLTLFAGGLALVFGAAFLLGDAVDPEGVDGEAPVHADESPSHHGGSPSGDATGSLRLIVEDRRFVRGRTETLTFRVVDREGRAVEDFDVEHERAMHVIAARHDLTGYQHVHPRRTGDGRWQVEIAFPESGPHRVFADFTSRGKAHTLGADVSVAGAYEPRPLPAPATTADAGEGYEVSLSRSGAERRFTVSKDGRPVDDIEPYLGARGHLVALRGGTLGFQHVHPKDEATAGREIAFGVTLPESGRYRMFLQFKHDGAVRTAAFTEVVDEPASDHRADGHGH